MSNLEESDLIKLVMAKDEGINDLEDVLKKEALEKKLEEQKQQKLEAKVEDSDVDTKQVKIIVADDDKAKIEMYIGRIRSLKANFPSEECIKKFNMNELKKYSTLEEYEACYYTLRSGAISDGGDMPFSLSGLMYRGSSNFIEGQLTSRGYNCIGATNTNLSNPQIHKILKVIDIENFNNISDVFTNPYMALIGASMGGYMMQYSININSQYAPTLSQQPKNDMMMVINKLKTESPERKQKPVFTSEIDPALEKYINEKNLEKSVESESEKDINIIENNNL